jgi:hypothetical protein
MSLDNEGVRTMAYTKGSSGQSATPDIPVLRHSGIGGPCEIKRKRVKKPIKGSKAPRTVFRFKRLTDASARRLFVLSKQGKVRLVRSQMLDFIRSIESNPLGGFREVK